MTWVVELNDIVLFKVLWVNKRKKGSLWQGVVGGSAGQQVQGVVSREADRHHLIMPFILSRAPGPNGVLCVLCVLSWRHELKSCTTKKVEIKINVK